MTIPVSVNWQLRMKLHRLGFAYDPLTDTWDLDWKKRISLNLDRSIGIFIWSASLMTAKTPASYVDDQYTTISWNQSVEDFMELKRGTLNYYIGDRIRKHMPNLMK